MSLSCTICEIQRNVGWKSPFFLFRLHLVPPLWVTPSGISTSVLVWEKWQSWPTSSVDRLMTSSVVLDSYLYSAYKSKESLGATWQQRVTDGQTDRQTDRQNCCISIALWFWPLNFFMLLAQLVLWWQAIKTKGTCKTMTACYETDLVCKQLLQSVKAFSS